MATRHKKLSNTTMLFIVIAIALAVIIISGGMPQTAEFFKPAAKCTDTDKGFNTAVQGTCTGKDGKFTDYCTSSSEVMEYVCTGLYCTNDAEVMPCSYGCSNGACIAPTLDLKYYSWPFVQANTWTGLIVVGSDAPPADIISATDIAVTLAQETCPYPPCDMSNTPVAKLDIEVTQSNKTSKNLILIGGDCVNRLIAEVENVSYGGCPSGQESKITSIKGDSWLALMNSPYAQGKAVLIVGGVNIADVRSAATILKDYKAYQAAGKLFGTNCAVRNLNGTLALSCT